MDNLIYFIIAIIAFIFGGVVISTKNKRTLELYKEEADKQADEAVKAKAAKKKSDKENRLSESASKSSSEIMGAIVDREQAISESVKILNTESTPLSVEEIENAKKILSDSD